MRSEWQGVSRREKHGGWSIIIRNTSLFIRVDISIRSAVEKCFCCMNSSSSSRSLYKKDQNCNILLSGLLSDAGFRINCYWIYISYLRSIVHNTIRDCYFQFRIVNTNHELLQPKYMLQFTTHETYARRYWVIWQNKASTHPKDCWTSLDMVWITLMAFTPITPLRKYHILVTKVPLQPNPMMRSVEICFKDSKQWLYIRHTSHTRSNVTLSILSGGGTRLVNMNLPVEWESYVTNQEAATKCERKNLHGKKCMCNVV